MNLVRRTFYIVAGIYGAHVIKASSYSYRSDTKFRQSNAMHSVLSQRTSSAFISERYRPFKLEKFSRHTGDKRKERR